VKEKIKESKRMDTEGLHRLLGQLKREIINVSRESSDRESEIISLFNFQLSDH
jgi:hypothetical protein